ncbi:hypothetical protein KR222_003984, partial [Zaprionus bogoriensis]
RAGEQSALHVIRNHNFLSTNSHEIRRSVDNMVDRLEFEGMQSFADAIRQLSTRIIEHPDWRDHYELDAQYAVIDFLIAMTYQPVQNIRLNREAMSRRLAQITDELNAACELHELSSEAKSSEQEIDWVALLSEDFIPPPSRSPDRDDGDSSLSVSAARLDIYNIYIYIKKISFPRQDWSESSLIDEWSHTKLEQEKMTSLGSKEMAQVYTKSCLTYPSGTNTYVCDSLTHTTARRKPNFRIRQPTALSFSGINCPRKSWCTLPDLPPLEPPKATTNYTQCKFEPNNLPKTIHSHWWRDDIQIFTQTASDDPCANFAIAYVQYLNRVGRGVVKQPLPKTISETALLREIIFMFFSPASCCCFEVELDMSTWQKRITVRKNVSISNVSSGTLLNFLEAEVLPAMHAMLQLRQIINDLLPGVKNRQVTGTLQNFAFGLRDLVQPIVQRMIAFEKRMLDKAEGQQPSSEQEQWETRTTLISFVLHMRKQFSTLMLLRSLAQSAIIDAPPYLKSVYLLSRLYKQTKFGAPDQKIATALLLVTLRSYCNIIDNWWRHSTLVDCHGEYVVQYCLDDSTSLEQRIRERLPSERAAEQQQQQQQQQEEPLKIIKALRSCEFYRLLVSNALEAGETQHLLTTVNLLDDLVKANIHVIPLYDDLKAKLFEELQDYNRSDEACLLQRRRDSVEEAANQKLRQYDQKVLEAANALGDPNVMDILTVYITDSVEQQEHKTEGASPGAEVLDVLDGLERCSQLLPPCVLSRALNKVLHYRCELANIYVMRWYHDEMQLTEHVRFLRHIMLMEADFALYPFYTTLFGRIESGQSWTNSSVLALELYEKLDPYYPSKACLLYTRLKSTISPKTTKVYEALDLLDIEYEMMLPLQRIVTEAHMRQYNTIWRFMLKVKWAAWKLENMRFIERVCKDAFAPLDLLGLTLRRLETVRFWLIYLINNLHSHLCTYVVHTLGNCFEQQIQRARCVRDLVDTHDDYINKVFKHCLLTDDFGDLRKALEQIFHLVFVLDLEWHSCCSYLHESHALSPDLSGETNRSTEHLAASNPDEASGRHKALEYLALNDVLEIERTYIRCHHMLATILTNLVYKHNHKFRKCL